MFRVKPLRSHCGHLLKVSVTCTNGQFLAEHHNGKFHQKSN